MNIIKIIAIAMVGAAFTSVASAQNTQLSASASVFETATTQWVSTLFNDMGFSTTVVHESEASDHLQVTASSGAVFYVSIRSCDDSAPKQCSMIQPYAFFNATGVTYSDINEMLRNNFVVSYAYLTPGDKGTVVSKIILSGGVAKGNVVQELARYFYDLDNLIDAISTGTKADVSFEPMHELSGVGIPKIDNSMTERRDLIVNAVGPNAPKFLTQDLKALID
jgi:hypothetical protein